MSSKAQIPTNTVTSCNSCGHGEYEVIGRSPDFEYNTCANEFSFGKCSGCGLVFIVDRPDVTALNTIYPATYIPYHFNEHLGPVISALRNFVQKAKIKPIRRFAEAESLIVDVGTGGAEFLRLLRDFGDPSWRLVGVDISDESMEVVKNLGLEAVQGRFESMPWTLPSPDVVVMNQVIEHLDNPKAVIMRSFGLLKPGGILMMETPSVDAWDARLFRRRYWGGWHTPRHWTLYTPGTLRDLIESVGFETVDVEHLLSPNFWLQSLHHKFSEGGKLARSVAPYFDVSNPVLLPAASLIDVLQLMIAGKTSNFRLVARKPA